MPNSPETAHTQPLPVWNKLIFKLVSLWLFAILVVITSTFLLLTSTERIFYAAAVWGLAIIIPSLVTWKLLAPLHNLHHLLQNVASGGIGLQVNIQSGDELEEIAKLVNIISENHRLVKSQAVTSCDQATSENNKLKSVISSLTDGVIVLNLHNQVVLTNQQAEKITGYTDSEMTDQDISQLIKLTLPDKKIVDWKEYLRQLLNNQTQTTTITGTVTGRTNMPAHVKVSIVPIRSTIQSDLGSIIIFHDITEEQTFEQMQIDFVSMASHEIRTPLTSIINYLATVSEEVGNKIDPELKDFIDRALLSAKQLSMLVSNLLNVSKVERGSFGVSLQPVDWAARLTQLVEDNQAQAAKKAIALTLELPTTPLPQVMADDVRINEVVNNLICNAINYTNSNGKVKVGCKLQGNEVVTYVQDSGIGIPKEAIPHLFTKFFRVAGSLEQGSKGTGLGLYISKSIVDLHQGKIWVESEPGKGSTFLFTLPITLSTHPTMANLVNPTVLKTN